MKETKNDLEKNIREYLSTLPKPHFSPSVKLSQSKIAGIGLIAVKDIKEGEVLVVELGPVVNRKFIEIVESLTGYECNLCIGWDNYILHQPLHEDHQGGYINHSCNPNVGLLANGVWCAIRDIKKRDEIVCDYGTFETYPGWAMKCKCGSKDCRKLITSKDYKNKKLREKLGEWFAPYLR
ncbi:MAG: SET domain-containing protein-lysine N-methyltransferase [Patescibacteria group bacterium]